MSEAQAIPFQMLTCSSLHEQQPVRAEWTLLLCTSCLFYSVPCFINIHQTQLIDEAPTPAFPRPKSTFALSPYQAEVTTIAANEMPKAVQIAG